MIDTEQVEDGRVQIVHGDDILDGPITKFISLAMAVAALNATPRQPNRKSLWIVVTALSALSEGSSSELPCKNQKG